MEEEELVRLGTCGLREIKGIAWLELQPWRSGFYWPFSSTDVLL